MFPIQQKFIKQNRSYKQFSPIGIVIHETANPNDSDEMEQRYFNTGNRDASAHVFLDADSITQCIPFNEVGWHAGRTANSKFLGVEMCHATTKAKFDIIYQQTVELFAYLFINIIKCIQITKDNLMSHAEVSDKWKETDHQDPIDYFKKFGKTVDIFRIDVQNWINHLVSPVVSQPAQWQLDCVQFLSDNQYIKSPHKFDEIITINTIGYIFNNATVNESNITPTTWLMKYGYTRSLHQANEQLSISTFAYMLANKMGETISMNPLDWLLQKGFITQKRTNRDELVTMWLLGAMFKNGRNNGYDLSNYC